MITKFIISAVAVFITAWVLPGVNCEPWWAASIVALILGVINTFIRPIVKLLALPINLITLGLFSLVINAFMVLLCEHLIKCYVPLEYCNFTVDGLTWALAFSIILAIVNWILSFFFKD